MMEVFEMEAHFDRCVNGLRRQKSLQISSIQCLLPRCNTTLRYCVTQPVFENSIIIGNTRFLAQGTTAVKYFRKAVYCIQFIMYVQEHLKRLSRGDQSRVEILDDIKRQMSKVLDRDITSLPSIEKRHFGSLSVQEILSIPPIKRGISNENQLIRYLRRLHAIQDFPPAVQQKLACVLHYEHYEAGRVIIKEGHSAMSVYFIWRGSVIVNLKEKDVRDNSEFSLTVQVLKTGDCFGYQGVLYGIKRQSTVISRERVELLSVNKKDFHDVLASTYIKADETVRYLSELKSLISFPMKTLCDNPQFVSTRYFKYNSVIMRCSKMHSSEWIVVVKQGGCRIVIELDEDTQLNMHKQENGLTLPCLPKSNFLVAEKKVNKRFLQLGTVEQNECFGLQLLFNKPSCTLNLISRGSECILISKSFFMKEASPETVRLLKTQSGYYPEIAILVQALNQEEQWKRFKQHVVSELVKSHNYK